MSNNKHPYDVYIRAFLDGKKVEIYKDILKKWLPVENLVAFVSIMQKFRIVPEDIIIEHSVYSACFENSPNIVGLGLPSLDGPNVRFVFDGMTRKLKSIEMIN